MCNMRYVYVTCDMYGHNMRYVWAQQVRGQDIVPAGVRMRDMTRVSVRHDSCMYLT